MGLYYRADPLRGREKSPLRAHRPDSRRIDSFAHL